MSPLSPEPSEVTFQRFVFLDFWTFGLLDYWSFGFLDFWFFGVPATIIIYNESNNPKKQKRTKIKKPKESKKQTFKLSKNPKKQRFGEVTRSSSRGPRAWEP